MAGAIPACGPQGEDREPGEAGVTVYRPPARRGAREEDGVKTTYTVQEINAEVARAVGGINAPGGEVQVRGEVTGCSFYEGEMPMAFFRLRGGDQCLSCVTYGRAMHRLLTVDMLTGEYFDPPLALKDVLVDSREVVCRGRLGTYARGSNSLFQLLVSGVADEGAGMLLAQLNALKKKLARLGYFAQERKRPLPVNPRSVALVTSPTGAVIHDFLRTARDRGLGARIRLYKVPVQGREAAALIADAVRRAGHADHEVIVLIRGGGSGEDLSCFNDEGLARAIFESPLPVLAGIGHEVDYTIADMTADVRASTPTMAAGLLWRPRRDMALEIGTLAGQLQVAGRRVVERHSAALVQQVRMLAILSPQHRAGTLLAEIEGLGQRLSTAMARILKGSGDALEEHHARAGRAIARAVAGERALLDREGRDLSRALLRLAEREASCVESLSGRLAAAGGALARSRMAQLDELCARLGRSGTGFLEARRRALVEVARDIPRIVRFLLQGQEGAVEQLRLQLEAVNPLQPLQRGFALLEDERGALVRSVDKMAAGSRLGVRLADGRAKVTVDAVSRAPDADLAAARAEGGLPDAAARDGSIPRPAGTAGE